VRTLPAGPSAAAVSANVALYNNVNKPGMTDAVNGIYQASPPDSTGAVGPKNYVEMVNSAIEVWSRALAPVSSMTLAAWVGARADTPYCDPQIQWDNGASRWLYVFVYCDPTNNIQEFDFGWSKTANPSNLSTGWCQFFTNPARQLYDYPKLGHNSKFMIVGTNLFDTTSHSPNPPPIGSGILRVTLPANGVTTCTLPVLHGFPVPLASTPVPVNTMTGAATGYVVAAYDPFSGPKSKLAVWHVSSSGVLTQDADVPVNSYSLPAPAPETNPSYFIDTLDGRLTQAVGDPTTGIWTQHTVAGPGGRSMVTWYQIKVVGNLPTLAQEGNISSSTDFVFNGAVSPRFDGGGAAVFYNRSSSTLDPVIGAQIRLTATTVGAMEPGELILAASTRPDLDFSCNNPTAGTPCRWGDYSGASPDPAVKTAVWGTNQVVGAFGSGSSPEWADQNFAVQVLAAPHAPTGVSATAGDGAATVFWTPSSFNPGSPVTSYTITPYVGATPGAPVVVAAPATSANFPGLTNGVTYTFTVFATNAIGDSPESAPSNQVTPPRQVAQSSASPPPRDGVTPVPATATPQPRATP